MKRRRAANGLELVLWTLDSEDDHHPGVAAIRAASSAAPRPARSSSSTTAAATRRRSKRSPASSTAWRARLPLRHRHRTARTVADAGRAGPLRSRAGAAAALSYRFGMATRPSQEERGRRFAALHEGPAS